MEPQDLSIDQAKTLLLCLFSDGDGDPGFTLGELLAACLADDEDGSFKDAISECITELFTEKGEDTALYKAIFLCIESIVDKDFLLGVLQSAVTDGK